MMRLSTLLDEMEDVIDWVGVIVEKLTWGLLAMLSTLYMEYNRKITIEMLPTIIKDSFTDRYDEHIKKVTLMVIEDYVPIEYKDSLFYIEKTLEEPSLSMNASNVEEKCKWIEERFEDCTFNITFVFDELYSLHKDARSPDYLVTKNEDDKLLKEIYDTVKRRIRHYVDNRINIPPIAITSDDYPMRAASPKEERNIPVASGVDRGGVEGNQLDTLAGVIVVDNNVILADRCGHPVTIYRAQDLAADTPVSLT
ncbi:hypothetical protein LOD99_9099 [Oopsacas minuta]|uniref:Uncharacterized protein n=1 Tax=Oopsacas minuta TaxID=111878 RepID=A0AAV7JDR2_9METZ|nr:hypothetical protein LOD99_9099 [Oopsacas minuta]